MEVTLLTKFPHLEDMEHNAAYAMLTCHANTDKLRDKGVYPLIEKAIKLGHETILEHINLTFEINDLSRACLQELARHRLISLSVESTRHTLKKQYSAPNFIDEHMPYEIGSYGFEYWRRIEAVHFLTFAKNHEQTPNDIMKYFIPEFWPTNLVMTLNVRELRHIVKLRSAPAALAEFQELARKLVEAIPPEFRYWVEDCVYKGDKNNEKNNE